MVSMDRLNICSSCFDLHDLELHSRLWACETGTFSRIRDQNGVSLLYIMFEIHQSGQEPSVCAYCKEA